ncbi:hypothetical protein BDN71DRAFT_1514165 [Pleurotus eryngii]|uniref:Uncharacterized protein n=1 Tax=Pleurotus eryngii TaxID=5323 RepID=A0A9P6D925_PLEER|nr:hypothetical protein BDN71DRAFT_1514165 [Pleurotus eryngii]
MKPAVLLWFTVVFCFATPGRAFPSPRKDAVKMPMHWLAMSKASTLDKGTDIWATILQGLPSLHKHLDDLFNTAAKPNQDVVARVKIITALLRTVEDDIKEFRKSFNVPPLADGLSLMSARSEGTLLSQVSNDIDRAFEEILKRVHEVFPTPDKVAHHDARQRLIKHILEEAEIELIKILCVKHNLVDKDAFRKFWRGVSPIIERVVVTMGDLAEQHPKLTGFVITGVITMFIPELWFTKPLLRLIGFGPIGTVEDSLAAWSQRVFYGANVHTKPVFVSLRSAL